MNLRRLLAVLFLASAGVSLAAPAPTPSAAPPEAKPDFVLVVVESLEPSHGAVTYFDRLDLALRRVAADRQWPVNFLAERFAANSTDHPVELRVYNQTIREDLPGERVFRAWMILTAHGAKHDFGVVTFTYHPRLGETAEDTVEKIFRGAAKAAADKVEPILFPAAAPKKA